MHKYREIVSTEKVCVFPQIYTQDDCWRAYTKTIYEDLKKWQMFQMVWPQHKFTRHLKK